MTSCKIPTRTLTAFRRAGKRGALAPARVEKFQRLILEHYRKHKRPFPWRATSDPYHIVVSEVMLQQTQTDRVAVKFVEFIQAFPTFEALAAAKLDHVLRVWQGMGYNRRAKALHGIAQKVMKEHEGKLPRDVDGLIAFPGIGPHTAASIVAYAFNAPAVFLETNIRTVYIYFFFDDDAEIHDDDLYPLVEKTLHRKNPNRWYNALMDYGPMLKKEVGNVSRRSRHYTKQSPFEGSNRQVRSLIVKTLLTKPRITSQAIARRIDKPHTVVRTNLDQLAREGLVTAQGTMFSIRL